MMLAVYGDDPKQNGMAASHSPLIFLDLNCMPRQECMTALSGQASGRVLTLNIAVQSLCQHMHARNLVPTMLVQVGVQN